MATIKQIYPQGVLQDLYDAVVDLETSKGAKEFFKNLNAKRHQKILDNFRKKTTNVTIYRRNNEELAPVLEDLLGRFAEPEPRQATITPRMQVFTKFTQLPAELRLNIWEHALQDLMPPRIIELHDEEANRNSWNHRSLSTFYASKLAKKGNTLLANLANVFFEIQEFIRKQYSMINAQSLKMDHSFESRYFFNFTHDILLINCFKDITKRFDAIGAEALSKIQIIALDIAELQNQLESHDKSFAAAIPQLKGLKRIILYFASSTGRHLPPYFESMTDSNRQFYEDDLREEIEGYWAEFVAGVKRSHLRNVEFQLAAIERKGLLSSKIQRLMDEIDSEAEQEIDSEEEQEIEPANNHVTGVVDGFES